MENAMRFLISTLTLASLLAAFVASDRPGEAAGYPAGPVKIVVPYPAGGPADFTARVLAEKLSEKLGGSFIVENLPGAGGAVGTATAARAAADGQTIVLVVQDFVIAPIVKTNVPFDPFKSFTRPRRSTAIVEQSGIASNDAPPFSAAGQQSAIIAP